MKKKFSQKTIKPTPEYDSKREQNVLIEEIYSSVKKVAEQVTAMKEEILTEVRTEIGGVKSELDIVKMAVMENSRDIKEIKVRQNRMEQKLDTALDNHEKRITKIEEKVGI